MNSIAENNRQSALAWIRERTQRRKYPPPRIKSRRRQSLAAWFRIKVHAYIEWRCERCRRYLDLHDPESQPQIEDIRIGMSELDRQRTLQAIREVMEGRSHWPI
jgi:hypothetical protein